MVIAPVCRVIGLGVLLVAPAAPQTDGPLTAAESSGYRATSRSAHVIEFLDEAAARAGHVRRFDFGETFEGRPLAGIVAASPMVDSPEAMREDPRIVVLILGNIHSGECAGKEALLRLIRELSASPKQPWLENLVLLIVPNYNADGNDRMAKNNRPGQAGPVEGMGTRANAQGLDLNRDYMKLESPEARALAGLMNRWNPHLFIDCHTTNGSWHRYDLTYDTQHNAASDPRIGDFMRNTMMPAVTGSLENRGISTFYYGNFNREHTRWSTADHRPRFGMDYYGLRGRLSILSEAYSYASYRRRIEASHAFVSECLDFVSGHRPAVQRLLRDAERRFEAKVGDAIPIRSEMVAFRDLVTIKGYDPPSHPRRNPGAAVSGEARKPPGVPRDYEVEFHGDFRPTKTVSRPFAYAVPAELTQVVELLHLHGVEMHELEEDRAAEAEVYRWIALRHAGRSFQSHRLASAEVARRREERTLSAGVWIVPASQPLGNLAAYLLEPESDDGAVTWNFLDEQFRVGADYPILRIVEIREEEHKQ